MTPKPITISADRTSRQLSITWDDEHFSQYPFNLLRLACPCVECRGGHEKMGGDPDPTLFDRQVEASPVNELKTIVAVGSYAVSPVWEDGHDAGIYNWGYLRALCPCPICRPKP